MEMIRILGVYISDRVKEAGEVQNVLTKYGCSIKTRLGMHEAGDRCAPYGMIILELVGDKAEWDVLESDLKGIEGVDVQKMSFK